MKKVIIIAIVAIIAVSAFFAGRATAPKAEETVNEVDPMEMYELGYIDGYADGTEDTIIHYEIDGYEMPGSTWDNE